MVASQNGHLEIVELLLKKCAEVNKAMNEGNTSIHYASCHHHLDVVNALLDAKANFFLKNNKGSTPLDLDTSYEIRQCIINHPWYRRRPLIVMRPHADHTTNKKHRMTALGWIVTAKEKGDGEDVELFDLRRVVASFL